MILPTLKLSILSLFNSNPTVLNFPVDNVVQAVDDLTKLGLRFEIY